MWGAIIGDLAGSIYEYDQTKEISNIYIDKLINNNSFYSDDTILTIAILDAMLTDKNFEGKLKEYAINYMDYHPEYSPYFKSAFSPNFIKWVKSDIIGNSKGNGALMRISPVAYLSNSMNKLLFYTYYATFPSHNSEDAINYAILVSKIIYLSNLGYSKNKIKSILNIKYDYKPFEKFNTTCEETINNCLYALFESNSYEDAVSKVISFGGDTDTNGAIVGSMAESIYGIDNLLIEKAKEKIPEEFTLKLNKAYLKIKK